VVISDHQVVISDRVLQRAAVAMRLGRSETLRRRRRRERRLGRPTTCCCSTQREITTQNRAVQHKPDHKHEGLYPFVRFRALSARHTPTSPEASLDMDGRFDAR